MNNYVRNYLLFFLTGVIATLVPTFLYINTLKKDDTPPFHFVPNAIAKRKPVYVQIVKSPQIVEQIKQAYIMDADLATIGSILTKEGNGLILIPKEETIPPIYRLKEIAPQKDKVSDVGGFHFIPDAIYDSTIQTQIIDTQETLDAVKKIKNLASRDLLSIGAGISCPQKDYCHITGKKTLENIYTVKRFGYLPTKGTGL